MAWPPFGIRCSKSPRRSSRLRIVADSHCACCGPDNPGRNRMRRPGRAEMRRGKAATVMKGPYQGDQLSVDHIIPRAVVPELDNRESRTDAAADERIEELARRRASAFAC